MTSAARRAKPPRIWRGVRATVSSGSGPDGLSGGGFGVPVSGAIGQLAGDGVATSAIASMIFV